MNEYASDHGTATERLIAFDSRYQGRHADEHASASGLDERKLHAKCVDKTYSDLQKNTRKTFDSFCRRWVKFCRGKGYHMLETTAKTGEAYLQAQRLEGLRLGHKDVGKNLEVQLNQFKKLCTIRGCPEFSKDEGIYMHNVITKASKDSAHAARSPPVDENRKQMDRSIISSDDLQELLRVCADTPDRLVATRAAALIKASLLTGESTKLYS
ncbi:TPA: hypothetical protein ACH3X1_011720 [Trebouxia sp. C0004]